MTCNVDGNNLYSVGCYHPYSYGGTACAPDPNYVPPTADDPDPQVQQVADAVMPPAMSQAQQEAIAALNTCQGELCGQSDPES